MDPRVEVLPLFAGSPKRSASTRNVKGVGTDGSPLQRSETMKHSPTGVHARADLRSPPARPPRAHSRSRPTSPTPSSSASAAAVPSSTPKMQRTQRRSLSEQRHRKQDSQDYVDALEGPLDHSSWSERTSLERPSSELEGPLATVPLGSIVQHDPAQSSAMLLSHRFGQVFNDPLDQYTPAASSHSPDVAVQATTPCQLVRQQISPEALRAHRGRTRRRDASKSLQISTNALSTASESPLAIAFSPDSPRSVLRASQWFSSDSDAGSNRFSRSSNWTDKSSMSITPPSDTISSSRTTSACTDLICAESDLVASTAQPSPTCEVSPASHGGFEKTTLDALTAGLGLQIAPHRSPPTLPGQPDGVLIPSPGRGDALREQSPQTRLHHHTSPSLRHACALPPPQGPLPPLPVPARLTRPNLLRMQSDTGPTTTSMKLSQVTGSHSIGLSRPDRVTAPYARVFSAGAQPLEAVPASPTLSNSSSRKIRTSKALNGLELNRHLGELETLKRSDSYTSQTRHKHTASTSTCGGSYEASDDGFAVDRQPRRRGKSSTRAPLSAGPFPRERTSSLQQRVPSRLQTSSSAAELRTPAQPRVATTLNRQCSPRPNTSSGVTIEKPLEKVHGWLQEPLEDVPSANSTRAKDEGHADCLRPSTSMGIASPRSFQQSTSPTFANDDTSTIRSSRGLGSPQPAHRPSTSSSLQTRLVSPCEMLAREPSDYGRNSPDSSSRLTPSISSTLRRWRSNSAASSASTKRAADAKAQHAENSAQSQEAHNIVVDNARMRTAELSLAARPATSPHAHSPPSFYQAPVSVLNAPMVETPLPAVEQLIAQDVSSVDLRGCQNMALPDWLKISLPYISSTLIDLDISSAGLWELPAAMSMCSSLQTLNISRNNFGRIPTIVGDLQALTTLIADGVGANHLPEALGGLKDLKSLSVADNELSHLPSWMHTMKLERLCIDGNPMQPNWVRIVTPLLSHGASLRTQRPPSLHTSSTSTFKEGLFKNRVTGLVSSEDLSGPHSAPISRDGPVLPIVAAPLGPPSPASANAASFNSQSWRGRTSTKVGSLSEKAPLLTPSSAPARSMSSTNDSHTEIAPPLTSARRPSVGNGLSTLLRRVGRKQSNAGLQGSPLLDEPPPMPIQIPQLPPSIQGVLPSPTLLSPEMEHSLSNIATDAHESETAILEKREQWRQVSPDHSRRIRALMHYLKDLHDLSGMSSRILDAGGSSPLEDPPVADLPRQTFTQLHSRGDNSPKSAASDEAASTLLVKDDSVRRARILQEILSTEETYARQLQELVDLYVAPMRAFDQNGVPLVPPLEHGLIFMNVESISQLHRSLVPSLRAAVEPLLGTNAQPNASHDADLTAAAAQSVAQTFLSHAAFMKMYRQYVNGLDGAQARVAAWLQSMPTVATSGRGSTPRPSTASEATPSALARKQVKRVRSFLQHAKADQRHTQINLESYLLLPVQRLPRYRLLLEDLVRYTPAHRVQHGANGFNPMVAALEAITELAHGVNEAKRQNEQDQRLLAWQARAVGRWPNPLVLPHRRLLRDGPVTLTRVVKRKASVAVPAQMFANVDEKDFFSDGAIGRTRTPGADLIEIFALQQQLFAKALQLILCNDLLVAVAETCTSKESPAPIELYSEIQPLVPVKVTGQSTIRVVGKLCILYLDCGKAADARAWCSIINNALSLSE
ncbi:Predicted Rho/Rac guanine nucleotide exchange factor/faciogenital dysplasia protein 3 [Ceraceosorus bombacis]|uniref:Predicted Rho/Rac guanine nucleotide exchange factor/faciogenital dysplasia protein 3 n=1 Tax=Ceraceosorus bombacis TaxID=401625 RepID=A0A0P1BI40_9BASI|nr:Predicted Rho/Rac guanine nucleotide exchange factor/faciogenital dysplasia protein 3 [Ceraceosorus bombacis]